MSKLSLTGVPVPTKPTFFETIIDNGRETVHAGSSRLGREVPFDIEFELARHKNLEFSLAFSVSPNDPRNAHLRVVNQPAMAAQAAESPRKGGLRSIFNSPKKAAKHAAPVAPAREPLLAALDRQGRLAQALIVFDELADQCLGRIRTFVFPVVPSFGAPCGSMRRSPSGSVGHITLDMVYIPPLPGMRGSDLPCKGDTWMEGLKTAEWWRQIWCEGSLNQMGADCPVRSLKASSTNRG